MVLVTECSPAKLGVPSELTGSFSCRTLSLWKVATEDHASLESVNEGQMALRRVQTAFKDTGSCLLSQVSFQ